MHIVNDSVYFIDNTRLLSTEVIRSANRKEGENWRDSFHISQKCKYITV